MTITGNLADLAGFDMARRIIGIPVTERVDLIGDWLDARVSASEQTNPELAGNPHWVRLSRESDLRLLVSALACMVEMPSLIEVLDPDEAHPVREVWLGDLDV